MHFYEYYYISLSDATQNAIKTEIINRTFVPVTKHSYIFSHPNITVHPPFLKSCPTQLVQTDPFGQPLIVSQLWLSLPQTTISLPAHVVVRLLLPGSHALPGVAPPVSLKNVFNSSTVPLSCSAVSIGKSKDPMFTGG
jgi:hypothetical protein